MRPPVSRLFRRRLPAWIVIALALVLAAGAPVEASSTVISAGPHTGRRVALTFDDGWDVGACARIASMLRANDAVGTFFINGLYVAGARAQWRRVLDGMDVGNHTRSHLDLARLSSSEIRHQISSNEHLLEQVLGRPILKLLRPPFGSFDDQVRQVASSLGYQRIVLWNHDTLDWSSSSSVSGVIERATAGGSGAIILMHCGPSVTVRALPAIIRSYRQRGYQLVGLSTLLGMHGGRAGGRR